MTPIRTVRTIDRATPAAAPAAGRRPEAMMTGALGIGLAQIDQLRRWQGRLLDQLGLGPVETPFQVVFAAPGIRLRRYAASGDAGPVLLIVPAPIKRAYVWDLAPGASVVRHCLDRGVRVYLAEWTEPGAGEQEFGLADYADRLILGCLDAIAAQTGEMRPIVAGHSLGGTLSAIFAALHPDRLSGLVLLESPLKFGPDAGVFAPLVAAAPDAGLIRAALGPTVPGTFLNLVSVTAAPWTFVWERWTDLLASLPDRAAIATHLRVTRSTLDEFPMSTRLFEQIVELLYREDGFMRGSLRVAGRRAAPDQVTVPLATVFHPGSTIIPPDSILPFHEAAPGRHKLLLRYSGDRGVAVQHLGVLVGENAHRHLWPAILDWMHDRWREA